MSASKTRTSDLLALQKTARARLERAMSSVQVALSQSDVDNGDPGPALRAAARRLRAAHEVLECLGSELAGNSSAEAKGSGPRRVNAAGGTA